MLPDWLVPGGHYSLAGPTRSVARTPPRCGAGCNAGGKDDAGRHARRRSALPALFSPRRRPPGSVHQPRRYRIRTRRHPGLEVKPEQAPEHRRPAIDGFRGDLGQLLPLGEAIGLVGGGTIGTVFMAKGLCYKRRKSIGHQPDSQAPDTADFDTWLGPAPCDPSTPIDFTTTGTGSGTPAMTISPIRASMGRLRDRFRSARNLYRRCQLPLCCHLSNISYRTDRIVRYDGSGKIEGDADISALLTRKYREPFVVPASV
jgi:hypothetical protein